MMNFQHLKNVSTLKLDVDKCTGCGLCLTVCPRQVLRKNAIASESATNASNSTNPKVHIAIMDNCIECGACMLNCPFGALTVDAGTGCAVAILNGLMKGTKPCC